MNQESKEGRKHISLGTIVIVIMVMSYFFVLIDNYRVLKDIGELHKWINEGVEIEKLVLDQRTYNPLNKELRKRQNPARILYFPQDSEVTLHFKLDCRPVFDNVSIISVKSPSGGEVEIMEDSVNKDYYYMNLTEKGYYQIEFKVWQDDESEENVSSFDSGIYWM